MIVDKNTEYYLIHSIGLTKTQIKNLLPTEIKEYCDNVIKKEIQESVKGKKTKSHKMK